MHSFHGQINTKKELRIKRQCTTEHRKSVIFLKFNSQNDKQINKKKKIYFIDLSILKLIPLHFICKNKNISKAPNRIGLVTIQI